MCSAYTVHLWNVSLTYKGYFIAPVQGRTEEGLIGFSFAVFDPFGQQLNFLDTFTPIDRFEDFWLNGVALADEDIERFKQLQDLPAEEVAILKEVGAIV